MSNYDDIFANSKDENQVENAPQEFNKEDWIAKKQKETFVRIEDGWKNCEFKYDGWVKN